jgi:hypothetical protein
MKILSLFHPLAGRRQQRISAGKHIGKHRTAPPCLEEALRRETIMLWFNDFHGSGVNPGSWVFLQSRYFFVSTG